MSSPRFEVASGLIDGINTIFSASLPYTAGSTAVFLNGQLKKAANDDGWIETVPASGIFQMKVAPKVGDVVEVFYLDTMSDASQLEIACGVVGVIQEESAIQGQIEDVIEVTGSISICG